MYCALQDAWPDIQNKQTSSQNQYYNNINTQLSSNGKHNMEIINSLDKQYHIENFNNDNCKYIIEHINNCPSCRLKFIKHKNNLFSSLDLNPEHKESIIVFLIGIMIILLLNLFIK
jgi:hypothetical protein